MDHPKVHSFFSHIARVSIIIPLVIIAIGIILRPDSQNQATAPRQLDAISRPTTPPVTSTVTPNISPTKTSTPINLQGPLSCTFTGKDSTAGLMLIKNKNILVKLQPSDNKTFVSNFLVKGDCLYRWTTNSTQGDKVCKISSYLDMVDMVSRFSALDARTLMGMFSQYGAKDQLKDYSDPVCQKSTVEDSSFALPSVIFTERSLTPSTKPTR